MKKVIFKKRHPYGGHYRKVNEVMEIPDRDALVLLHIGAVDRYTPPPQPVQKVEEPKRRGRPPKAEANPTLVAESPPAPVKQEEPEAPENKPAPTHDNTYQTRQLKAE